MDDDPFVNQDSIFKDHANANVESKIGANKSDKRQHNVTLNNHDSYNALEDQPIAFKGAISEENIDDNVENAQESKKLDENRKRMILNNYKNAFQYQCPNGNLKINKVTVSLYMVFRIE